MEVKDYFGNPIEEGDIVCYLKQAADYYDPNFSMRKVVKFKKDEYFSYVGLTGVKEKNGRIGFAYSHRVINMKYVNR